MRNNWPRIKISEVCDLIVDCVNKTAPSVDEVTPFRMIRTPNIKNGRLNLDNCRFVHENTYESWTKRAKVLKGDVLLTREAPMGEVGMVNVDDSIFLGQRIMQYRANLKKLHPDFLLYSFLSPDLQSQFRKYDGSGSIVSHIRVPDCTKFEIYLPKLEEQQKVANVLKLIDQKIEVNSEAQNRLNELIRTIYNYWFIQFDFPDENGKPYKSSGGDMIFNNFLKREIPAVWSSCTLSELTSVSNESISPSEFSNNEFNLYSIPVLDATKTYSKETGSTIGSNKFIVSSSDILVSKLNPWFNRVVYAMDEKNQLCSTEFVVWKCKNNYLKNFLYMIATSQQFITHSKQSATGTSNSHKRVKPNIMMQFKLPFEKEVVENFNEKIEPALKRVIFLQRENTRLSKLRDWLLPMLMNGQVTVK